jgi:hypothetical protein
LNAVASTLAHSITERQNFPTGPSAISSFGALPEQHPAHLDQIGVHQRIPRR